MPPVPLHTAQGRLLAVDDGKGSLGDLPLRMLRLGVQVLHSSEIDEAELMARQEGQAICGVLLPSQAGELHVDQAIEVVGPHTGVGADRVALLGPRIDEKVAERLRERGVRWRLWEPYEDRDLRFVGWSLVWATSDQDLRLDHRVPTALPAHAIRRGDRRDVLVGDLSASGAFLETRSPFPAGSQLGLEIELPNRAIEVTATVRWVSSVRRDGAPGGAQGFGVEFLDPPAVLRAALEEHLESETARFLL
ncbi:MAG: PilZ domain-containing protein [Myxococcota bacterium]